MNKADGHTEFAIRAIRHETERQLTTRLVGDLVGISFAPETPEDYKQGWLDCKKRVEESLDRRS